MANAIRFKQLSVERQKGELARFKVVQGPDYGAIYVITGPKAFIGRGEENDLVISDLKASRIHAEVTAVAGGWMIKDKGSANGILHNGQATREAKLAINDTVTLGETTLEFTTSEVGTQMLVAPPRSMFQIAGEQQHHAEHKERLSKMGLAAIFGGGATPAASSGAPAKPANQLRKFAIIGVVLGVAYFMFGNEDPPIKPAVKKKQENRDLAAFLPDAPYNREVDMLFKDGLREYFLGNLSRARTQFETVLQISPGHPLSTLYLQNVNQAVDSEVKLHLDYGKKAYKSGKLHDSKAHFLKVMRLLNKDRNNPSFIEAKEQFEKVVRVANGGSESGEEEKKR